LHGPFASIEEAREDVLDCLDSSIDTTVDIRIVEYITAEEYADAVDMDDVLESMNERVWDDYHIDEVVFDIGGPFQARAREELTQLVRGWVIKHVCASGAWRCGDLVERVTYPGERCVEGVK
jgi:hypothetical protein